MRKFLAAATAALGLMGMTIGQVQAQHIHGGSDHAGSVHGSSFNAGAFRGNSFRGNSFRGNSFRGAGFRDNSFRGNDRGFRGGNGFAAGVIGFGLGAALASPYYYDSGYYDSGYYGDDGYYAGDDYDSPAYDCGGWRWDPYRHRRIWVEGC
jgi:hypothetical protein